MSITTPAPVQTATPRRTLRIAHLDDMRELCDMVRASLGRDGHEVLSFNDGAAALEFLQANHSTVDLFISDHHMPRMNGLEVVRRLRQTPFAGKIFIFSSEIDDDVNNRYLELKVDRVMSKPILMPELRGLLAEF